MARTPTGQPTEPVKGAWFGQTSWTVIATAQQADSPEARQALEKLCRLYWYPLYAYIRRSHPIREDAEDSTQAFFHHLFERNFLGAIDRKKGKFRSFLIVALRHFLENEREFCRAAKRGGGKKILSLDETIAEGRYLREAALDLSPEMSFERDWAATVAEGVYRQLEGEQRGERKLAVYNRLRCFLSDATDPGDYQALAAELKMTPNAVAIAVYRLRHRFGELLRAELAQTVATPDDLEEEVRHFFTAFARNAT